MCEQRVMVDGWLGSRVFPAGAAYKNHALRADGKTARVSEHRLLADTIPAAARARARQHLKLTIPQPANAMVACVGDVRTSVGSHREAARVEERRAASGQVHGLWRRRHRALEHLNRSDGVLHSIGGREGRGSSACGAKLGECWCRCHSHWNGSGYRD